MGTDDDYPSPSLAFYPVRGALGCLWRRGPERILRGQAHLGNFLGNKIGSFISDTVLGISAQNWVPLSFVICGPHW